MKKIGILCFGILSAVLPAAARADYMFSGSGTSGTLVSSSETWQFNHDGGAAATGYLNDWGSPGVSAGITTYGEPMAAYGFEITFSGGGTVDAASIATGNASACAGTTTGGTTFCNISTGDDIWEAFQVGPDSIDFLAQNATFNLAQNDQYFVNIFFDGATPTSFTGSWLTSFTPTPPSSVTPEPSSLLLLATGFMGAAGRLGFRRMKRDQAA
ncbi:MAG TPA: PEP-CTERM sorting domain-containing protein [Acidobacteriaceae bacterium]|nr:PEP-CTERM sorting domain-containing protein [Acidobacteriaceae bacterium]